MTDDRPKVMVQFHFDGSAPSLADVAARFSVPIEAIDPEFGVIVTDEADKLCTVLVPEDVARVIAPQLNQADSTEGRFSNPGIASFGPPE